MVHANHYAHIGRFNLATKFAGVRSPPGNMVDA